MSEWLLTTVRRQSLRLRRHSTAASPRRTAAGTTSGRLNGHDDGFFSFQTTLAKAAAGERLSADEGLLLLESHDLAALGQAADDCSRRLHPEPYRTYSIDRNINYTNICTAVCDFCAFYRGPRDPAGYVLSRDELLEKIRETVALGGDQILLQGGCTRSCSSTGTKSCSGTSSGTSRRSISTVSVRRRSTISPRSRSCRCGRSSSGSSRPVWGASRAVAARSWSTGSAGRSPVARC